MNDSLVSQLDKEIDKVQSTVNALQEKHFEELKPYKEQLLMLGDIRRVLTMNGPSREDKSAQVVALEEEVIRLRTELKQERERKEFKYE
jgi:hypothetical protein